MKHVSVFAAFIVLSFYLSESVCHANEVGSKKSPNPVGLKTIQQVIQHARDGVEQIDNAQLQARIQGNPKLVLLDVRTKEEYDAGHIKGATWLERGIAEFTLARVLRDPNAEIVVYCGKGNRSALVVKALKQNGYQNVKSHIGFESWVEAGLTFHNFLGEAKMVKLREINASTNPIDLYQDKK